MSYDQTRTHGILCDNPIDNNNYDSQYVVSRVAIHMGLLYNTHLSTIFIEDDNDYIFDYGLKLMNSWNSIGYYGS